VVHYRQIALENTGALHVVSLCVPSGVKGRAAPIKARGENVARGCFLRVIWLHRAIIAINNWFE